MKRDDPSSPAVLPSMFGFDRRHGSKAGVGRELNVSPEVAEALPAPVLAQMQAVIDDPDNECWACKGLITGPSAEVVVVTDGSWMAGKFTHSECMASAVQPFPGLTEAFAEVDRSGLPYGLSTALALRHREPRALIFLEPEFFESGPDEDPLELFADARGLSPISGGPDTIDPPTTDGCTIVRVDGGLEIRAATCTDHVPVTEDILWWLDAADGRAIVATARGLALRQSVRTVEEALMFRPAWGGVASIAESD